MMQPTNRISFAKYGVEFLSVFIAVIAAFALNNWNDHRKAEVAEVKILREIANGLRADLSDIRQNDRGHAGGIRSCAFWRSVIHNVAFANDSVELFYRALLRDYVSLQNGAGYQTLKSRGLELIENDSLRLRIISLYEYDYALLRKLEEEYDEMQFHANYAASLNAFISPYLQFGESGNIIGMDRPLKITDDQRKSVMIMLWRIEMNREFIRRFYGDVQGKIETLMRDINKEIA